MLEGSIIVEHVSVRIRSPFFYIIRRFNRFSFLSPHKDSGSVFNLHLPRVTHKKKSNCESKFEHKSIACSTESRSTRVRFAFLSCKKVRYRLRRNEGISRILIKRRRLRSRLKLPRFSTFSDRDRPGKSLLISRPTIDAAKQPIISSDCPF